MSNDLTMCNMCKIPKEEIPCNSCDSLWSKLRGYCKRCDDRGYLLECPDEWKHDNIDLWRRLEREIKWGKGKSKIPQGSNTTRKPIGPIDPPKPVCSLCGGTGIMKLAPAPTTPNYWVTKRCPRCG